VFFFQIGVIREDLLTHNTKDCQTTTQIHSLTGEKAK